MQPMCGAHRTNGEPCGNHAMMGKRVCRPHGGASLSGRAHPRFTTGRKSKYANFLPSRMLKAYEASMDDGQLLQQRQEISLLDSRITDLLTRVDTGESGRLWDRLGKSHAEFAAARHLGKVPEMQEKLAEMEALIAAGRHDADAWRELQGALDLRRKIVESERRRLLDAQQSVTAEQLTGFMTAMLELLDHEIKDRKILSRISEKLYLMATVDTTPVSASSVPA